jgi:hypothetical protein
MVHWTVRRRARAGAIVQASAAAEWPARSGGLTSRAGVVVGSGMGGMARAGHGAAPGDVVGWGAPMATGAHGPRVCPSYGADGTRWQGLTPRHSHGSMPHPMPGDNNYIAPKK